ncbi:hypothetical protein S7711_09029, partial [Stachybotrys chartarum IBT 7711]
MKASIVGLVSMASTVLAQAPLYGQCGGMNWAGPVTCASGSYCLYFNEWYSQNGFLEFIIYSAIVLFNQDHHFHLHQGHYHFKGFDFDKGHFHRLAAREYCLPIHQRFLTNDADVNLVMDHIQQSGLRILRIWGFNDVNTRPSGNQVWFQYLSSSGSEINTGPYGLQRLDVVVRAAETRGIKLIINFVNNWNDYGGFNAYMTAFGGTRQQWFTNTAAQAQYRAYIRAVVSRYLGSRAILAWELANEPRCPSCSTDIIYNWARDTSAYIKSLDPNHLVTLGDEGFGLPGDGSYPYGYSEGSDFARNLNITTLDFATFHLYPESWGTTYEWGNAWVRSHAALCAAANKPCLFEEYGATDADCATQGRWQDTSLAAAGMAGDAFWQYGDTISTGTSHDDGHTVYYGS